MNNCLFVSSFALGFILLLYAIIAFFNSTLILPKHTCYYYANNNYTKEYEKYVVTVGYVQLTFDENRPLCYRGQIKWPGSRFDDKSYIIDFAKKDHIKFDCYVSTKTPKVDYEITKERDCYKKSEDVLWDSTEYSSCGICNKTAFAKPGNYSEVSEGDPDIKIWLYENSKIIEIVIAFLLSILSFGMSSVFYYWDEYQEHRKKEKERLKEQMEEERRERIVKQSQELNIVIDDAKGLADKYIKEKMKN